MGLYPPVGLVDPVGLIRLRAWFKSKRADRENHVTMQYNVTMSDDIVALAKVAVRQATLINMLSLQLADQACLLETQLKRCSRCQLGAVTVEHTYLKIQACDRCAAEVIVKSGRAYIDGYAADPDDPLNLARMTLMNERDWVDVADADKVRRVVDYVKIIKELEVNPDRMQ